MQYLAKHTIKTSESFSIFTLSITSRVSRTALTFIPADVVHLSVKLKLANYNYITMYIFVYYAEFLW